MRERISQTSINLLIAADLYQRLKMTASLKKISMSEIVRDGINLRLAQIDKENNSI